VRVAFADPQQGLVAFDAAIRRTLDGGRTWTVVHRGRAGIYQLQWVGEATAFALTGTSILRSQDGGAQWEATGDAHAAVRIWFLDRVTGYAVAGGGLLFTADGGASFKTITTGLAVQAAQFLTPRQGWVAAPDTIASTADGGRTWQARMSFATTDGGRHWTDLHPDVATVTN